ncbi:MAG: hypothetical protein JO311_01950, partial [Candidatus Eremiobacteraeota bacterium]|nr:hypothetical protein [Candidatus Eremiobacteraeota bacterium]
MRWLGLVVALLIGGCVRAGGPVPPAPAVGFGAPLPDLAQSKIQHVVIVIQENRSTNELFNGLPGAHTVRRGLNSLGQIVRLRPHLLTAPIDLSHKHSAFITEYANGKMNGFDLVASSCAQGEKCPPSGVRAYAYVPQHEVQPYFEMAERYSFADRMFQTNQGPSFPAHQYLLSGTSTISDNSPLRASENPVT